MAKVERIKEIMPDSSAADVIAGFFGNETPMLRKTLSILA